MIFSRSYTKKISAALMVGTCALTLAKCAPRHPNSATSSDETATFIVQQLKTESVTSVAYDSSLGVPKSRSLHVGACIVDSAQIHPVIGEKFQIQLGSNDSSGATTTQATTDSSGCLHWSESHPFSYLSAEQFTHQERVFVGLGAHGGSVHVQISVNPWRSDSSGLIDLRYAQQPDGDADALSSSQDGDSADSNDPRPQIKLSQNQATIYYSEHDYGAYEVDPYLNLTMAEKYLLSFVPYVFTQSLDAGKKPQTLYSGKLKITMAIFTGHDVDPLDQTTFVASNDGTFDYHDEDGLKYPFEFKFSRIPQAGFTNRIMIHLESAENDSAFRGNTYIGKMPPVGGGNVYLALTETKLSLKKILNQLPPKMATSDYEKVNPYMTYLHSGNIIPTSTGALQDPVLTDDSWEKLLNGTASAREKAALVRAFCQLVYNDYSDYKTCYKQPSKMVQIHLQDFVETLHSPHPVQSGDPHIEPVTLSVSVGTTNSETDSSGHTTTVGGSASAKAGAELGPFAEVGLGVSAGFNWFWTHTISKGTGNGYGISGQRPTLITEIAFNIDATVRRCLIFSAKAGKAFTPRQICKLTDDRKILTEEYVNVTPNTFTDASGYYNIQEEGQSIAMFLRGQNVFEALLQTFRDDGAIFTPDSVTATPGINDLLTHPAKDPNGIGTPGAVETAVSLTDI